MKSMAEIYLPSIARNTEDLITRYNILQPARDAGHKTGLMLVLRSQNLDEEAIESQL